VSHLVPLVRSVSLRVDNVALKMLVHQCIDRRYTASSSSCPKYNWPTWKRSSCHTGIINWGFENHASHVDGVDGHSVPWKNRPLDNETSKMRAVAQELFQTKGFTEGH
jgi:hypothetical protein